MWLQGISQRKIAEVTAKLGAVKIGKDAVSRIAQRLDSELQNYRGFASAAWNSGISTCIWMRRTSRSTGGVHAPRGHSHVGDLALLVAIGVNAQGYREVLALESAAGEKKESYRAQPSKRVAGTQVVRRAACGL